MICFFRTLSIVGCALACGCSSSNSGLGGSVNGEREGGTVVDSDVGGADARDASGQTPVEAGFSRDVDAAGTVDVTSRPDADVRVDAAASPDAEGGLDAAVPGDAGGLADTGVRVDAATPVDSGSPVDVGAPTDAGVVPDAVAPEGGVGPDGGSLPTTQAVIAHRGASGHAPEHTLAAYDLAISMGADYIEQDIAMTADGILVCLHDATLDRTARGDAAACAGSVATKTLAQLKQCDMGSWFNEAYPDRARPEYVGQKIPTLEEVFQRFGGGARYYIETKTLSTSVQMEPELLRLLNQYGLRNGAVTQHSVLIQSFDAQSLQRMHALDAELPLILLGAATASQIQAAAAYAFGIGPTSGSVNSTLLDTAHGLRMAVHPYTVNENAELERLARLCVDGMFTNFPDRYRAIVDAGGLNCPPAIR